MQAIQRKLHSRRGASILLALFFLLVCAVVGSVVLTAASGTAGRVRNQRESQQAYLTVSSAVRLIQGQLADCTFTASSSESPSDSGIAVNPGSISPANALTLAVCAEAQKVANNGFRSSVPILVEPEDGAALEDVSGTLELADNYTITVTCALTGGKNRLVLTIPAEQTQDWTETIYYPPTYDVDGTLLDDGDVDYIRHVEVRWGTGIITRGASS